VDEASAPQGLNCAGFGSSVMVTASFGMAAAQWAVAQVLKDL
jgi:tRNA A37 threonylcarbamoyladenosine dehydratase